MTINSIVAGHGASKKSVTTGLRGVREKEKRKERETRVGENEGGRGRQDVRGTTLASQRAKFDIIM